MGRSKYWSLPVSHVGVVIQDVTMVPAVPDNGMESFWIAETLKYLWLLFGEPAALPLDKFVLTTEAHPILIDPRLL